MMRNRPEFHVVDLATTFLRATPVSIYNSSSPEELQYLVGHAEAEIAIVEDFGFLERFMKVRAELLRLRRIFVIDPPPDRPARRCGALRRLAVVGHGQSRGAGRGHRPGRRRHADLHVGNDRAGEGAMIGQQNVVHTCEQLSRCYDFALGDDHGVGLRYISYLPMAHIAEQISSHYNGMRLGSRSPVARTRHRSPPAPARSTPRSWAAFPGVGEGLPRGRRGDRRRPGEAAAVRRGRGRRVADHARPAVTAP